MCIRDRHTVPENFSLLKPMDLKNLTNEVEKAQALVNVYSSDLSKTLIPQVISFRSLLSKDTEMKKKLFVKL